MIPTLPFIQLLGGYKPGSLIAFCGFNAQRIRERLRDQLIYESLLYSKTPIFAVDYTALINYDELTDLTTENEERLIARIKTARSLKLIAKESRMPVVAVAHGWSKNEGRPQYLSDVQELGLLQEADQIVLFKDGVSECARKKLTMELAKNRYGPLRTEVAYWSGEQNRFISES